MDGIDCKKGVRIRTPFKISLKFAVINGSGEGEYIPNIPHACQVHDAAFKT